MVYQLVELILEHSSGDNSWYDGYISDLRIYKGIDKYDVTASSVGDQAFVPRSTNPDILPNTPSGTTLEQHYPKLLMVLLLLMERGDALNTRVDDSTDFSFGTNDFTIEMFLYNEETGGTGFIIFDNIDMNRSGIQFRCCSLSTITTKWKLVMVQTTGYAKTTGKVPAKQQWCHVAFTGMELLNYLLMENKMLHYNQ